MNNIFHPDFREFIECLNLNKVEYLVIGGYAVGFHGYVRATGDIDFWINKTKINAEKLVKAVIDFGVDIADTNPEMFLSEERLVTIGELPVKIEILNKVSGLNFEECYKRKITAKLDGIDICVLNLDDLILNKMRSNRDKDQIDIKNLKDDKDKNS
jgi:predicted nucleotidyltransferase